MAKAVRLCRCYRQWSPTDGDGLDDLATIAKVLPGNVLMLYDPEELPSLLKDLERVRELSVGERVVVFDWTEIRHVAPVDLDGRGRRNVHGSLVGIRPNEP